MLNPANNLDDILPPGHIFIAKVVFIDDPLKLERIKVEIPKVFEGAEYDKFPWVGRKNGGPIANGDGHGSFGLVPRVGSRVWVEFLDGNPLCPVYWTSPFLNGWRMALANENYPNRYGWKDPAGNHLVIDVTEGKRIIELQHYSGTFLRINDDGSIDLTAVGDINSTAPTWNHTGNTVNLKANVNIEGFGQVTKDLRVKGTIRANVDVFAKTVSLFGHKHDGVQTGTGTSKVPVGGGTPGDPGDPDDPWDPEDPGNPTDPEIPTGPGTPGVVWSVSPTYRILTLEMGTQYTTGLTTVYSGSSGAAYPVPLTLTHGMLPPGVSVVQSGFVGGAGAVSNILLTGTPTLEGVYEATLRIGTSTQTPADFGLQITVTNVLGWGVGGTP